MKKVSRNTQGLKDALFDELDQLRSGTSTPQKAKATTSIIKSVVDVAKLEMDFVYMQQQESAPKTLPNLKM